MSAIFDWARPDNVQPEPITMEIWRELPEEYCRQVEVVDGRAVKAESPSRQHQKAARWIAGMVEDSAGVFMAQEETCLDVDTDFDVVLWELPAATIRRPDVALFECAPPDERPLSAHRLKLVVEVVSPGSGKMDTVEKKAEYAAAGIPWYWLVWVAGNQVTSIEVHVLEHVTGQYRLHRVLDPVEGGTTVDVPIRIKIDWERLAELAR